MTNSFLPPVPARRAVVVVLLGASLFGCVAREPAPYPYPPAQQPAPRALRIEAQRRQSQAQQDRDKGDCQSMASAMATSSETWARAFASCMTSRGYSVD